MKLRHVWLPNLRDAKVHAEVGAECRSIAASLGYEADLAFIEAVRYYPTDDE